LNRPYGEFIAGGNDVAPGQVDEQVEWVTQMKVNGKTVILPNDLEAGTGKKLSKKKK
jgi:hypothetical protein